MATVPAEPTHPCPLPADLWVLAGQSNMQGYGYLREERPAEPRVLAFSMDNRWGPAQHPLHRLLEAAAPVHLELLTANGETLENAELWLRRCGAEGPAGGVGPGLAFAQHLYARTRRAIGLIPCAHGGTSLEQWSPALKDQGGRSLYGAMLERIAMVGGRIKGILWYQGESDCTAELAPTYAERFAAFIETLRADLGQPELPFLFVQLGRLVTPNLETGRYYELVREAQRRVARRVSNAFMVPAADLCLDDLIHISAPSQERLGRRLGEAALSCVYGQAGHGQPIDLASVEALGTDGLFREPRLRLRFSGVSGALRWAGRPADFELRSEGYAELDMPVPYRVELDPEDPAALIVHVFTATPPAGRVARLHYGPGANPYMNLLDEHDMAVPAFGPVEVRF